MKQFHGEKQIPADGETPALFVSFVLVSVYMADSQIGLLKEKSKSEFKTITASLSKDISVLSGRNLSEEDFNEGVSGLINGYTRYYQQNDIQLGLEELTDGFETELSFISSEQSHSINIQGPLTGAFWRYRLYYSADISKNISELRRIQIALLLLALAISIVTAFALYAILTGIFKPLGIVARISRRIANGLYNERIRVKGRNEISYVAEDFNRMAAKVEKHIHILEDTAIQKQRFIDNFAHEIRTPLTSIYGYAEYMQNAKLSEAGVIESAQYIMKEAGYMRKIADSLLELATLRNQTAADDEVALPPLLEDTAQTLWGLAPEKKIKIIYKCEADTLRGQEDLLRSLLLNLGFNAVKACPAYGGLIRLEAKEKADSTVLSVTDNGCGIPEESIAKVTEPFYRVDETRNKKSGGAGLGLALCRQIALAHNANMRIKSEPGRGTKVEIIFTTS